MIFNNCGFSSETNFRNWYGTLVTKSPVLFPKTEDELSDIVREITKRGCRIRVRGAGHSESGIVMLEANEHDGFGDVVTVHLKDIVPHAWNGIIFPESELYGPSIKIPAGASTTELVSITRPKGYLMTTNTAGAIFSVGGLYLNPSTIGSQSQHVGRCAVQVVGLRVLVGDGTYKEFNYTDPELKDFRGSLGLLGIVTGLQIQLKKKDTGIIMKRDSLSSLSNINSVDSQLNETKLKTFLESKLSTGVNDGFELFYHHYEDMIDTFEYHFNDGGSSFDPLSTSALYQERLEKHPDLAFTGGNFTMFSQALGILSQLFGKPSRAMAGGLALLARREASDQWDTAASSFRDGFWFSPDDVLKVAVLYIAVKCKESSPRNGTAPICLDEIYSLLDMTRRISLEIIQDDNSKWYPDLPIDLRLFKVGSDEMLLEHYQTGTYVGFEFHALQRENDQVYARYLTLIENRWHESFPNSQIHHGKQFGYDMVESDDDTTVYSPFQNDAILDAVYTEEVKVAFLEKMNKYDPKGIFRAGSALRMLGLSAVKDTRAVKLNRSMFSAGIPNWLLAVELLMFALSLVLFGFTFTWFRRRRNVTVPGAINERPSSIVSRRFGRPASHSIQSRQSFITVMNIEDAGLNSVRPSSDPIDLGIEPVKASFRNNMKLMESVTFREENLAFPTLFLEDFVFSSTQDGYTIMKGSSFWLGGCKVTAIQGPSGSGKSTFLRLLSGYRISYMEISIGKYSCHPRIIMCQQHADMWPEEMLVRDVLLFACNLFGAKFEDIIDTCTVLGLILLFDLPFGTISGGQQQLVNIATCLIQPEPSLIFLDEPMAALDTDKAYTLLRMIKKLPTEHSFVMTAHMCEPKIQREFNRVISFNDEGAESESCGYKSKSTFNEDIIAAKRNVSHDKNTDKMMNTGSIFRSVKAMVTLWHGQFNGLPKVEVAMFLASIISGLLVGYLVRGSVSGHGEDFYPFRYAHRLPLYFTVVFMGMSILSSLGISSVYDQNENKLLKNFVVQGSLHPLGYVVNVIMRSTFFALIQTIGWYATLLPIIDFVGENTAVICINTLFYCASWTCFSFLIVTVVHKRYSIHVLVILSSFSVLLSGTLPPWKVVPKGLKVLHYINPLFYCVVSSTRLILGQLQTGCLNWELGVDLDNEAEGQLDSNFPSIFMEKLCAPSSTVLHEIGLPAINSYHTQGISFLFVILSSFFIWLSLTLERGVIKEKNKTVNNTQSVKESF